MAAGGRAGDEWQTALIENPVFSRLHVQGSSSEESSSCGGQLKNLICTLDGDLLLWEPEECSFRTIRLPNSSGREQRLLCINPPLFDVTQILLSPAQHHITLIGSKGLMVLEIPKRWGKNSEFEGGEKTVNCRTIPIAERIFTSSTSLVLKQATWYPCDIQEPHLLLLTSDNTIRIYSLQNHLMPVKVIPLSNTDEETSIPPSGHSYKASLGETAVAFDFGPLLALSKGHGLHAREQTAYPLYILYENGETFLMYIKLQNNISNISKLLGPLPMHPAAEDNYGYDACAVLCLPCIPNILVIATESGLLYHCVVLEGEDDDDQTSNKSWNSNSDLIPSLYVFECVELELALKLTDEDEPMWSDFSCPIKLYKDPVCPSRYHCTHMAGVHSVGLTWLDRLEKFLSAGEEDKDSLQELAAEQKCIVEHILCTKPLPCRLPAPIQGFWIISDFSLGTTMICITNDHECITRPLLTTVRPPSPSLLNTETDSNVTESLPHVLADVKGLFENHISEILRRNSANPLFLNSSNRDSAPPPEECLQLLSRSTQVFREEYVLKQELAREEIQRRVKLLIAQKQKQQEDLQCCKEGKKTLKEMAERLAEKFEEAKDRQEDLINRLKVVLRSCQSQLQVISDSERDMKKELQTTHKQLHHLDNAIKQVKMKMDYQEKQMEKGKSPRVSNLTLSDHQRKSIQTVLKEEGEHIQEMVKQINDIRTHVNF